MLRDLSGLLGHSTGHPYLGGQPHPLPGLLQMSAANLSAHSSRSSYPNIGLLLMLISIHLPDELVPQISIILYNRTTTKKGVEVLNRTSQSNVVNQNLELEALFSTKRRTHKNGNS